jgi:outer membrane protein assembly factor BamD
MNKLTLILIVAASVFAVGCTKPALENMSPDDLFSAATDHYYGHDFWSMGLFRVHDYTEAIRHYDFLIENFPYSRYNSIAMLRVADANFYNGGDDDLAAATAAYLRFVKQHTTNPLVPYAYYQVADAYYEKKLAIDRETSSTQSCYSYFSILRSKFPSSGYSELGESKRLECWQELADHEYYVAYFFYNSGYYQASISRFDGILQTYPDTTVIAETLYYKALALESIGQENEAKSVWGALALRYPDDDLGILAGEKINF